ncbi:MAG: ferritin family protein [Candidatus Krumholzibacteriia bacterium]
MAELKDWESVDDILDFAIEREREAAAFYTDAAARTGQDWARKIFEQFAREERGHEAKLQAVKEGERVLPARGKIADMKMADYLADVDVGEAMNYQQILIVAMKREKAAFRLYTDLAERVDDPETRQLFRGLAMEEAKHKLRFEIEYDELILRDN